MSEWKEIEFYKMLVDETLSYGVVQPGKHTEVESVPIIRGNNIRNGNIVVDDVMKISKAIEEKHKRTRLKGGELLITVVGSVGECAIVPKELSGWNVARAISVARIKDEYNAKFIKYALRTTDLINQMYGNTNDTVQPTLNLTELKNLKIKTPDIYEQKSIAEVLSSLDDKIDLLHQQNKTLEALAETLFRQWFDDDNSEWEEMNLGSVVEILRGLSYKGAGLSDSNDVNAIPMINLNSVNEGGGFKYTGTKYYNGEYKERHLIIPGDVVITNTEQGHEHRLIGFSAIIPNSIGPKAIFSQHIYKLKPKDTRVTSLFINYLLNYSSLRDQVIGATNGSTVNMLSLEGLEKCKIQLPPKSLITKFEAFAKDIQAKKEVNVNQINQLEILRNNLLPKLMSGAVTVSSQ